MVKIRWMGTPTVRYEIASYLPEIHKKKKHIQNTNRSATQTSRIRKRERRREEKRKLKP